MSLCMSESPIDLTAEAFAAAAQLREWLLAGPAQLRNGVETGGVAGTLNSAGQADYVYGEITGYYLHWLAGSQLPADPRRGENARAALAWCERHYGSGAPVPTRIALTPMPADWRNDTEFCFDLAMLVGGLSAAAQAELIEPPRALLDTLMRKLNQFAAADRLLPVAAASAAGLPDRWSTRSGPFLVKAAARILSAAAWVTLPAPLESACRGHLRAFAPRVVDATADPLHPTLYFLEGTLALAPEHADSAREVLQRLLVLIDANGSLPESLDTPAVRRSDIIAQALRVGLILESPAASAALQLDALAAALVHRVRADGSISFQPVGEREQINVWCAMFAEQALSWYATQANPSKPFAATEIV